MAARPVSWTVETGHYVPLRCLHCLGFDLTAWDLLRVLPCILWGCLAITSAGLFLQYPIVQGRRAHLLPMLGALQSAMPAFMCAVLLLIYHRQRVRLFGLPRETAGALGGFYGVVSTLGCFVYLTLLMATVFVFQVDRTEEPAYFFLSSTWLLVTLLWFILQSCLRPSPKQVELMVRHYEATQSAYQTTSLRDIPSGAVGVVVGAPIGVAASAPT